MKLRGFIVLFLCACVSGLLRAQLTGDTVSVPAFLNKEKNVIEFNGGDWSPLFAEMDSLQSGTDSVPRIVSMVHIGDSHVQAGFFTEAVRLPLQRRFGDAGRGLVVPLKLARTNEPHDYSVVADGTWNFARCVGRKYSAYTPGIGGIAIVPRGNRIDLTFSTLSKTDDCAGFRKVRLFHEPTDSFPAIISEPYRVMGEARAPFLTCYSWNDPVCSIHFSGQIAPGEERLAIYGASLETGESGILYHTIGNNGAFYSTYAAIPRFAEQVAALSPRLIIVSLGTNESFSTALTRDELYKQIDAVVTSLRASSPQAVVLLTTPAECARRRTRWVKKRRRVYYSPNSRVDLVRETIRAYAADHRLACWDWYEVAGGKGSSTAWRKAGLMAYDRTHCTETGYRIQGEMLYRALMKAYQDYVDHGVAL
ncbi:MAG TPA: hypothetical protein H9834_10220 [Candidatus Barnesiella excrementavium]|nr:hypothetical protein [Candidatus Barnesiella excrementavium]